MSNSTIPAPVQTNKVLNSLKTLKVQDSVQFRPANGGEPILMKVDQIGVNKKDPTGPRMFVGYKNHKQIFCLETQVTRVITRSVDNEADWIDDKFVPEQA